jgi:hypothetical protein
MGSIYERAYLTISATRADTCHDGFLAERPELLVQSRNYKGLPDPIYARLEVCHKSFFLSDEIGYEAERDINIDMMARPLEQRAWCFL